MCATATAGLRHETLAYTIPVTFDLLLQCTRTTLQQNTVTFVSGCMIALLCWFRSKPCYSYNSNGSWPCWALHYGSVALSAAGPRSAVVPRELGYHVPHGVHQIQLPLMCRLLNVSRRNNSGSGGTHRLGKERGRCTP